LKFFSARYPLSYEAPKEMGVPSTSIESFMKPINFQQYLYAHIIWVSFVAVYGTNPVSPKTRYTRFYLFSLIREQSFCLMLKSQDGYMQILE